MTNLALKYRPETFEDLVGQEVPAKFLSTLIKRGKIARNIILAGKHGSGKSSSARIYARALNCESPTELGSPCNVCESCRAFFEHRHTDYSEYDAASNSKVEEIRDFIQLANSPPMMGDYRVLVLDEAHALSRQAWESLLKIVEEPPPYLVFIFATTELSKVRPAIQSRCRILKVSTLDFQTSLNHLKKICTLEGIQYEENALALIAHVSKGHPRDMLSNLEQVSFLSDVIDTPTVSRAFGLQDLLIPSKFFDCIFRQDSDQIQNILYSWASPPSTILQTLQSYLLLVWNRHYKNSSFSPDPIIEAIPFSVSEKTHTAMANKAKEFQVDLDQAYTNLFAELHKFNAPSIESIVLNAISLANFVATKGFGLVKILVKASGSPSQNKSAPQRVGRRFSESAVPTELHINQPTPHLQTPKPISTQTNPFAEPLPLVTEVSLDSLPDKVFPHNLSQSGFKLADHTQIKSGG